MTNEELALLIQEGNNRAKEVLWNHIINFVRQKAYSFYINWRNNCRSSGRAVIFEFEDLIQEGYIGMLEAVKYYNPHKEYNFITYLNRTLKTAFATVAGIRLSKDKNNPLNRAVSFYEPITEEEDLLLIDTVADPEAEASYTVIELTDTQRIVSEAVSTLPELQRSIIKLHYSGMALNKAAEKIGISRDVANRMKSKALQKLRANKELRRLYDEYNKHYSLYSRFSFYESLPEYFELIEYIQRKEAEGEYISYGKKQALIYDFAKHSI